MNRSSASNGRERGGGTYSHENLEPKDRSSSDRLVSEDCKPQEMKGDLLQKSVILSRHESRPMETEDGVEHGKQGFPKG